MEDINRDGYPDLLWQIGPQPEIESKTIPDFELLMKDKSDDLSSGKNNSSLTEILDLIFISVNNFKVLSTFTNRKRN